MNWKQAFTLGLLAPGVWDGQGEPVAYLYGKAKVRLPDIYSVYTPELQKEFPFASIVHGVGYYYLLCWSVLPVVEQGSTGLDAYGPQEDATIRQFQRSSFADPSDPWVDIEQTSRPAGVMNIVAPFWTGTDLYRTDGSRYLEASDPIPVYE